MEGKENIPSPQRQLLNIMHKYCVYEVGVQCFGNPKGITGLVDVVNVRLEDKAHCFRETRLLFSKTQSFSYDLDWWTRMGVVVVDNKVYYLVLY